MALNNRVSRQDFFLKINKHAGPNKAMMVGKNLKKE